VNARGLQSRQPFAAMNQKQPEASAGGKDGTR
jgi:hypothetical protein